MTRTLQWLTVLGACAVFGNIGAAQESTVRRVQVTNPFTEKFVDVITFSTERTGIVAKVPKEGMPVAEGDIVVQLKDDVPQAILKVATQRASATGEIGVAEKAAASAWLEYNAAVEANRLAPDPTNGPYPETDINRLKLAAEGADARTRQAQEQQLEHQLTRDQAATELGTYRVTSHIAGVVTHVHKRQGEGVQQGEPIVEITNTDAIRVSGDVQLSDAFQIKQGMPVVVTAEVPLAGKPPLKVVQEGKLGWVDVKAAAFEDVRVWVELPNPNGILKQGMNVQMEILVAE